MEFLFDLRNSLRWGKPNVSFLLPATDILQLKIHWTEVQLRLVRLR
jgi:hypothetical protein